jgi:hypothetical protein
MLGLPLTDLFIELDFNVLNIILSAIDVSA